MESSNKQHVIIFPFMAQGHITPFLLLANLIQKRYPNNTITFINTPLNVKTIKSSLPRDSTINLKSLPFDPSAHGLPPGAENTADIPVRLFIDLFQAAETLRPSFEELLSKIIEEDGKLPLCIISDNFLGWTVESARRFGIFHSIFHTGGAYGYSIYYSLWKDLPHRNSTSDEFPLFDFPEVSIHRSQMPSHLCEADGPDSFSRFVRRQVLFCMRSDAMLANTVEVFEPKGMGMLRRLFKLPVWSVGPLLHDSDRRSMETSLLQWLDSQPPASVLYVSFGSQNTVNASQMMELATALEASSKPFIWVIRPPVGFDIKGGFRAEWLPENFEERMRTAGKGVLVHQWASQVDILSHSATGAFLSHCGWNSVLESLTRGVPIIAWPLTADQFYNSTLLEEAGVCVEVARGNGEGSKAEKEEVERVIQVVIGGDEKGKEMRRKAKEIGELLKGALKEEDGHAGSSIRGLDEFLELAASKRGQNRNLF